VVSAAGLVQGIVLVTFPAASTIFTDGAGYGLSSGQYGAMFLIPGVAAGPPAGWPGPRRHRKHGTMTAMRYQVREKMFSIGDDFWVTDEQGNQVFLVDGKALRVRQTFELKDRSGAVAATIHKKLLAVRETMEIERDGAVLATVKKALVSPLHHRFVVELRDGGELEAVGNIVDKEFEIRSGHQVLAQVSRSWFRIRDTYGVDVAPGEDDALMIAVAVCLDRIHHDEEERRSH
jgi:uncharacterized protein YxjI